jgi:Ser/Thr protein kinase RdoA (MazF antagonist)
VTPFAALGQAGRTRRLKRLAESALARYDVDLVAVRPLTTHFNAVFRVETAAGERLALRVNRPDTRLLLDIRSELSWLTALRRETDLIVPDPVPAKDGALVVTIEAVGVPEARHCALFRWIEGRSAEDRPTPRTLSNLGATMARLHEHADGFDPPAEFTDLRLDQAWTFGRPAALDGNEPDELWTPERRRTLTESAARVQAVMDEWYADPILPRFLHADLHLGNVRVSRAGLGVLDFDDSCWCPPVQDIGTSLFYLQHRPDFPELRAAFERGYTSVRPWPETAAGQVEVGIAARWLDLISLTATSDDPSITPYLSGLVERGARRLGAWLG